MRQETAGSLRPGRQGMLVSLFVILFIALASGAATDPVAPEEPANSPLPGDEAHDSPPGGSSGPAENTIKGYIYQATPESARWQTLQSQHGVTHYRVNVQGDAPFLLRAQVDRSAACFGATCVEIPDFDIAFYRESGGSDASVGERHYGTGPEEGTVPKMADFAHVYLRTPGVVPDSLGGYGFVYLQGNPGSDQVPDWP